MQRFFGGALSEWLTMPVSDLVAMAEQAIVLDARERMDRIVDGQIAAGLAKRPAASRHLRDLRRRAGMEREQSLQETLREAGITVVEVSSG